MKGKQNSAAPTRTFENYVSSVNGVAIRENFLFTCHDNGQLCVKNLKKKDDVKPKTIKINETQLLSLRLSPNELYMSVTGGEGHISLYGFYREELSKPVKIKSHSGCVRQGQFSSDSKFLITASDDKSAKIFQTNSGKFVTSLVGHNNWVHSATFAKTTDSLALTGGRDARLILFDVPTKTPVFVHEKFHAQPTNLDFSHDDACQLNSLPGVHVGRRSQDVRQPQSQAGSVLCGTRGLSFQFLVEQMLKEVDYDVERLHCKNLGHKNRPLNCLSLTDDEQTLAVGGDQRIVEFFDLSNCSIERSQKTPKNSLNLKETNDVLKTRDPIFQHFSTTKNETNDKTQTRSIPTSNQTTTRKRDSVKLSKQNKTDDYSIYFTNKQLENNEKNSKGADLEDLDQKFLNHFTLHQKKENLEENKVYEIMNDLVVQVGQINAKLFNLSDRVITNEEQVLRLGQIMHGELKSEQ